MPRKIKTSSIQGNIKAKQNAKRLVPVPPGVRLRGAAEQEMWDAFTHARDPDSWRDMDLVIIGKIVKYETQILKLEARIDVEGYVLENARGTMTENPIVRSLDQKQRMQLALLKSISLGITAKDGIALNSSGTTENDKPIANQDGNVVSLLA